MLYLLYMSNIFICVFLGLRKNCGEKLKKIYYRFVKSDYKLQKYLCINKWYFFINIMLIFAFELLNKIDLDEVQ